MSKVDPSTGIFQLTWEKTDEGTDLKKLEVIPCNTQYNPDYRPFELTDAEARKGVWQMLMYPVKKVVTDCVRLPDSFAETGVVLLDHGVFTEETSGS